MAKRVRLVNFIRINNLPAAKKTKKFGFSCRSLNFKSAQLLISYMIWVRIGVSQIFIYLKKRMVWKDLIYEFFLLY